MHGCLKGLKTSCVWNVLARQVTCLLPLPLVGRSPPDLNRLSELWRKEEGVQGAGETGGWTPPPPSGLQGWPVGPWVLLVTEVVPSLPCFLPSLPAPDSCFPSPPKPHRPEFGASATRNVT